MKPPATAPVPTTFETFDDMPMNDDQYAAAMLVEYEAMMGAGCATLQYFQSTIDHALNLGSLLFSKRKTLPHGRVEEEMRAFIRTHKLPFKYRVSQQLIRLHKHPEEVVEMRQAGVGSIRGLLKGISRPRETPPQKRSSDTFLTESPQTPQSEGLDPGKAESDERLVDVWGGIRTLVFGALDNLSDSGYTVGSEEEEAGELIQQRADLEMYSAEQLIPFIQEWKRNHARPSPVTAQQSQSTSSGALAPGGEVSNPDAHAVTTGVGTSSTSASGAAVGDQASTDPARVSTAPGAKNSAGHPPGQKQAVFGDSKTSTSENGPESKNSTGQPIPDETAGAGGQSDHTPPDAETSGSVGEPAPATHSETHETKTTTTHGTPRRRAKVKAGRFEKEREEIATLLEVVNKFSKVIDKTLNVAFSEKCINLLERITAGLEKADVRDCKPPMEAIIEYAVGYGIEDGAYWAERFYWYEEGCDWQVGSKYMVNWQAALHNYIAKEKGWKQDADERYEKHAAKNGKSHQFGPGTAEDHARLDALLDA